MVAICRSEFPQFGCACYVVRMLRAFRVARPTESVHGSFAANLGLTAKSFSYSLEGLLRLIKRWLCAGRAHMYCQGWHVKALPFFGFSVPFLF